MGFVDYFLLSGTFFVSDRSKVVLYQEWDIRDHCRLTGSLCIRNYRGVDLVKNLLFERFLNVGLTMLNIDIDILIHMCETVTGGYLQS